MKDLTKGQKAGIWVGALIVSLSFLAGTKLRQTPPTPPTRVVEHYHTNTVTPAPVTHTKTVTKSEIPAICRKAITGAQQVVSAFTPLADAPQVQADIFSAARIAIFDKDIAAINKQSNKQVALEGRYTNVLQDLPDDQSQALADMKSCLKEVH